MNNSRLPSVVGTLIIHPRSGKYESDADWFGKMDPLVVVTFGNDQKTTEVAKDQGKTPVWKAQLAFSLRTDQLSNPNTLITFDTFDADGKTKREAIGAGTLLLSEISKSPDTTKVIKLYNAKNKFKGTITVDFRITGEDVGEPSSPNPVSFSPTMRRGIGPGTLIVRPKLAILKAEDRSGKIDPYVVVIMGDQAYQTSVATGQGRQPQWQDALSFDLRQNETLMVRVLDAEEMSADDPIGEALINLQYIGESLVQGFADITINLEFRGKDAGQLTLEFELNNQVFDNPVKFYSTVDIPRGGYACKKIKYSNPDNQKKTLSVVPNERTNLVQIRNPSLTLNAKSYTEIRVKLFAPKGNHEEEAQVDVIVEELGQIEESLIFRIRSI